MTADDEKTYKEFFGLPDDFELTPLDLEFIAAWIGGQFDPREQPTQTN